MCTFFSTIFIVNFLRYIVFLLLDHEIIGSVEKLIKLRTNLLIYLKRLFTRGGITDDEMQLILAFLTTVHEVT